MLARKIADGHRWVSFIDPGSTKRVLIEQLCDIGDEPLAPPPAT